MSRVPRMKAVMTPFPYSVEETTPVTQALDLMMSHEIQHLPVKRAGGLAGVITDQGAREVIAAAAGGEEAQPTVVDVPRMEAYVVDLETRLDDVALMMADRHIDCALVTRDGRLVGLFTTTDACRVLGEHLRLIEPPPPDDDIA